MLKGKIDIMHSHPCFVVNIIWAIFEFGIKFGAQIDLDSTCPY